MTESPAETVAVVAAIFLRSGRALGCRRAPGRPPAGRWEFPGGKVEPGETAEAALVREIGEELQVHVDVGALLDRSVTRTGAVRVDLSCFLVDRFDPEPLTSTDHDRLLWCSAAMITELDWAAPDRPAVQRLIDRDLLDRQR